MSVIRGNEFAVILDAASARKIINAVSFSDGERFFGIDAERMAMKNPAQAYVYSSQLLGKLYGNQLITDSATHYPYFANLLKDEERGTYNIRYDDNTTLTVEGIAGMILDNARTIAEAFLKTKVRDCVITVPPQFTLEERTAVIEAAKLAKLNVLSLINDGTSVALHYAFGRKFEETPQHVVFYDMGHTSTRATVVEFRSLVLNKGKKNTTVPQLRVKSVGWDATLGGREFNDRVAQQLAKLATEQLKQKFPSMAEDLSKNAKVMARLLTAAEKAKTVLSANQETTVSVESLVGDFDFRVQLKREQFEEWCDDLFKRVAGPVLSALQADGLTMANITAVELVGGGVRVPKVQAVLKEALGVEELHKHLNGDEAAVLGAVFYGAQLSTTMKVPEYRVKDMSFFPIRASLVIPEHYASAATEEPETVDPKTEDDEELQIQGKEKVLTLFKAASRLGARKNLSFHTAKADNFTVELTFESPELLPPSTPEKISFFTISGVEKTRAHNYTGKPKIGLGFRLTTSGLVELEKAEAEITVVKWPEPEPEKVVTAESDDDDDDNDNNVNGTKAEDGEEKQQEEEGEKKEEEKKEEEKKEGEKAEEKKEGEEEKKEGEEKDKDSSKKKAKKAKKEKKAEVKKGPKKFVHRIPLQVEAQKLGIPTFSSKQVEQARLWMVQWDAADLAKKENAEAKNDLETYIYATKEKLDESSLEEVSTEAQREAAREALTNAGEWLYDDGDSVSAKEYKDKLQELKKLAEPIFFRAEELKRRPVAVDSLLKLINASRTLTVNITKLLMVEEAEVEELLELADEAETWLLKRVTEQEAKAATEDPVLKSEAVYRRGQPIEKKLQSMVKRKRRPPPPPPPTPTPAATADANATAAANATTIPAEEGEATQQTQQEQQQTQQEEQQTQQQEQQGEAGSSQDEEQQRTTLEKEKGNIN